jgi:hypothetical protein
MALLQAHVGECFFHADRIERNLQSTARTSASRESDGETID